MHDEKDHSMQQLRHRNCASIRPESVSASNRSPNEADGSKATGRASRVRGLIESSTCLQADEDLAFLRRPEMCGIRLQLDYWKTEESLQWHAIGHTIVVYGNSPTGRKVSTHCEPRCNSSNAAATMRLHANWAAS